MRKIGLLGLALLCGAGHAQVVKSNLNGKRIYLQRNNPGHEDGFVGLRDFLEANKTVYGYTFEYSPQPLGEAQLDSLYNRLYKGDGQPKAPNTIDILIFGQGEGDENIGKGNMQVPAIANAVHARQRNVATHVRSGGAFLMVHAAAGRGISWYEWDFGARLMADWFLDGAFASPAFGGNSGHFSAGTPGTAALDDETLPATDSSLFFIRKLFTTPKANNGYGQPVSNDQVKGEWYHFNGGFKYEDGTGGPVTNPRNLTPQRRVRGDMGEPDSGIGPAKVVSVLTKIGTSYVPPGKGRVSVWAREISKGKFDPKASATNGRWVYFNPGHASTEWKDAGGWMGDLFLSCLRWTVKDDRGCMSTSSKAYAPLATVNDCGGGAVAIGGRPSPAASRPALVASASAVNSALRVSVASSGAHTLTVSTLNGETVYSASGNGSHEYRLPGMARGAYLVEVAAGSESFRKQVSLP